MAKANEARNLWDEVEAALVQESEGDGVAGPRSARTDGILELGADH